MHLSVFVPSWHKTDIADKTIFTAAKSNLMLIIADKKIAEEAKEKLSDHGDLMELETSGITYPAISGHPDIFFCQGPGKLVVAPNLPHRYFDQLTEHKIEFIIGEMPVGPEYPMSARYNAVATPKYLIHNFRHTDFMITRAFDDLEPVHVDQGYCRCNLLPLKDDCFITSDGGIEKVLMRWSLGGRRLHLTNRDSISISETPSQPPGRHPSGIILEGFPHGFFAGCCGILDDKIFINGNLDFFHEGEKVRNFLAGLNYEIIELNNGPLVDVGCILFIK